MAKPELLGEVKKLISIGKEKGFLTYDELNSTLPAEVVSSEQFGSIMTMFGEMDIEIVDAPEGERIKKARDTEEASEEAEEADVEAGAGAGEENEKEEKGREGDRFNSRRTQPDRRPGPTLSQRDGKCGAVES